MTLRSSTSLLKSRTRRRQPVTRVMTVITVVPVITVIITIFHYCGHRTRGDFRPLGHWGVGGMKFISIGLSSRREIGRGE